MDTSFLLFAANNPIQYSDSMLDLKSFQIIILEDVINELIGISNDKGITRSRNALNALAYTRTLIHQKVDRNGNTDDKILSYAHKINGIIASLDRDLLLKANKNSIDTVSIKKGMLIWKVTYAK